MRIVYSVHAESNLDSGAAGVTYRIANALEALGHETAVITFSDLGQSLTEIQKAVLFPWFVSARVARMHRENTVDVLDSSTGDAWPLLQFKRPGKRPKVVVRSHGLEHLMHKQILEEHACARSRLSWKYPIYHGGLRLREVAKSLRMAEASFFLNEEDRDHSVNFLGVSRSRSHVVRNGISDQFLVKPPERDLNRSSFNIVFIGSYLPRKGVEAIAAALNVLLPHHPNWRLTFLGCAVDPKIVYRDYHSISHPQISVIQRFQNIELPQLLADQDILLFPSKFEGQPLSLLEAMATGVVPVASDIPGIRSVVTNGTDGLLTVVQDVDAIVRALERLATSRQDLAQLSMNAVARAAEFNWTEIATSQELIYRSL